MSKRLLNSLFAPTETVNPAAPSVAAPPERDQAAADQRQQKEKQTQKPQSVYLTKSELAYIQEIADTFGESRHAVIQYAVRELINQWKQGNPPRTNILGKLDR